MQLAIGSTVQLYFSDMLHDVLSLFAALLWPATLLVLAFGFRQSIKQLVESLTELRLLGDKAVLKWPQARVDTMGDDEARVLSPQKTTQYPDSYMGQTR